MILNFYIYLFGSVIGSFLNVVIYRLPRGEDLVFLRSRCVSCEKLIKPIYLIPVFGYFFSRGRCHYCHKKFSILYPFIELVTGIFCLSIFNGLYPYDQLAIFLFNFSIFCVLLCHFFIDIKHQLLLDKLNIYLFLLLFSKTIIFNHWKFWFYGAVLGFSLPLIITLGFYYLRNKVGLGGGDIKLFGILGLILGPLGILQNLFLSCFLGALIGISLILLKKLDISKPMPFGPFIILVAFFQIFYPSLFKSFIQFVFFV